METNAPDRQALADAFNAAFAAFEGLGRQLGVELDVPRVV